MSMSLLKGTSRIKGDATEVFYNDCPPDMVELAQAQLATELGRPVLSKLQLTDRSFGTLPRSYILCTEDQAITIDYQKQMLARQACDKTYTLNASHSPFLSMPDALVDALIEVSE